MRIGLEIFRFSTHENVRHEMVGFLSRRGLLYVTSTSRSLLSPTWYKVGLRNKDVWGLLDTLT